MLHSCTVKAPQGGAEKIALLEKCHIGAVGRVCLYVPRMQHPDELSVSEQSVPDAMWNVRGAK